MKLCEKCYHDKSDDFICPYCRKVDWTQIVYPILTGFILVSFAFTLVTNFRVI